MTRDCEHGQLARSCSICGAYQAGRDAMLEELRVGGVELPEADSGNYSWKLRYTLEQLEDYGDRRVAQAKSTAREEVLAELRDAGVELPILQSRATKELDGTVLNWWSVNQVIDYGDRRAAAVLSKQPCAWWWEGHYFEALDECEEYAKTHEGLGDNYVALYTKETP